MSRMTMGQSKHAEPFWEATKEKKLMYQYCTATDKPVFYPRQISPYSLKETLEWRESSGKGEVYAVTVVHKPTMPMYMPKVPYAVAIVELDEGYRMMSEIVNADVEKVKVGDRVKVTWEELSGGKNYPVFEPDA